MNPRPFSWGQYKPLSSNSRSQWRTVGLRWLLLTCGAGKYHFLSHLRGQQSPSEQPEGSAPELRLGSVTSSGLCLPSVIRPSPVTTCSLGTARLVEVSVSWPVVPSPGVSGLPRPENFRGCPTQGPPFQERCLLWDASEERASPSVYWSAALRVTGQWDQGDWLVPVSGKTFSFQGQMPVSWGFARTPRTCAGGLTGRT